MKFIYVHNVRFFFFSCRTVTMGSIYFHSLIFHFDSHSQFSNMSILLLYIMIVKVVESLGMILIVSALKRNVEIPVCEL